MNLTFMQGQVRALVRNCEPLAIRMVQRIYPYNCLIVIAHQHPSEFAFEGRVANASAHRCCYVGYRDRCGLDPIGLE